MASFAGPNITNNNLAFNLDAGNVKSYPGSGATWNDLAGTEIHGTVNSATYTDNAHGKYFAFDGTDDYISFAMGGGDPEQLKLATWSTECWFQWHSGGSTAGTGGGGVSMYPLVTKGCGEADNNNLDMNYGMGVDGDGKIVADFERFPGGSNHPVISNTAIVQNVWTHALVSYDGASWGVYINGAHDKTEAENVTARYDSLQHNGIGCCIQSTGNVVGRFSGKIAIARIYNRALTAAEVLDNYNSHKGRFGL